MARSWWTRSRPATSRSAGGSAASTRPPAATATPVGWHLAWISRSSSTTARTSTAGSLVATSSPGTDVILVHRLLKGTVAAEARSGRLRPVHERGGRRRSGSIPRPWADGRARSRSSTSVPSRPSSGTSSHAGRRRAGNGGWTARTVSVVLDVEVTLAADPSVVWAHLTAPALRSRWEGPLVIEETSVGGPPRRRDHLPVRHRPPRDDRGDRRLAALRPHRLAARGPRCRAGRGDGRPRSRRGWHAASISAGLSAGRDPPMRAPSPRSPARSARPWVDWRAMLRRGERARIAAAGGTEMIRYSSEVTIARPPRAVYEALLDADLYPKWTDMVDVSFDGADDASGRDARAVPHGEGPHQGDAGHGADRARPRPTRRLPGHAPHPRLGGRLDARARGDGDAADLRRASSGCTAGDGCSNR